MRRLAERPKTISRRLSPCIPSESCDKKVKLPIVDKPKYGPCATTSRVFLSVAISGVNAFLKTVVAASFLTVARTRAISSLREYGVRPINANILVSLISARLHMKRFRQSSISAIARISLAMEKSASFVSGESVSFATACD